MRKGDVSAQTMIMGVNGVDPERRQRLIDILEIDLEWRMHTVSDGQRRRIQICLGLLKQFKVIQLKFIIRFNHTIRSFVDTVLNK